MEIKKKSTIGRYLSEGHPASGTIGGVAWTHSSKKKKFAGKGERIATLDLRIKIGGMVAARDKRT